MSWCEAVARKQSKPTTTGMETNMNQDKAAPLVGIVLTALSAVLMVGILSFAASCGVHDDGTTGPCLWAARAVVGVDAVLLVLSIVRIFERDEGERRGLSLGAGLLGGLVAVLPGLLIDLCAAPTMRCHAVMRPFCVCMGAAIAVVGLADLIVRLLRIGRAR